jgi:uncharacterized RDD family membrane protein YckC
VSLKDPIDSGAEQDGQWRAEVASRVDSYRSRRGRARPQNDAFDFDAASSLAEATAAARRATPQRGTFDTNYYRRLNSGAAEPAMPGPEIAVPEPDENEAAAVEYGEPASAESWLEAEASSLAAPIEPWEGAAGGSVELPPLSQPATSGELFATAGPQSNVIVFPRPLIEPMLAPTPNDDELAEPVLDRPRILEVPEEIMPAVQGSLFPEIRLEPRESELRQSEEPVIEVPLPVAPMAGRMKAGAVDFAAAAAATAILAAVACAALPEVPHTKPFWMVLAALLPVLWALYQFLFLLYGGRTAGMAFCRIRLSTFDGRAPRWGERRRRASYLCISLASGALGFLWALVDDDLLCMHDRISHTFPTQE